eukprot:3340039-Ditylum_brightwellii.AAC.1
MIKAGDGIDFFIFGGQGSGVLRSTGGNVQIVGGSGTSEDVFNGGNGEAMLIDGGALHGRNSVTDHGGSVHILGSQANSVLGGNLSTISGKNNFSSSGNVM